METKKSFNKEYLKKIIWAVCWDDNKMSFDLDECFELLRNLGLINIELAEQEEE